MRLLATLLPLLLALPALADDAEPSADPEEVLLTETERVFMPDFELGVMGYGRDDIGIGFVTRTSMEYRLAQVRAPFLRVTYDVTTSAFRQPAVGDLPSLRGTHTAHDVLLGGGFRAGPDRIQAVFGIQGGLHLDAIPRLVAGDDLEVSAATTIGAAVRLAAGLELYVTDNNAITAEVLGQRLWGPIWTPDDGWAGGGLLGFTTAL